MAGKELSKEYIVSTDYYIFEKTKAGEQKPVSSYDDAIILMEDYLTSYVVVSPSPSVARFALWATQEVADRLMEAGMIVAESNYYVVVH